MNKSFCSVCMRVVLSALACSSPLSAFADFDAALFGVTVKGKSPMHRLGQLSGAGMLVIAVLAAGVTAGCGGDSVGTSPADSANAASTAGG